MRLPVVLALLVGLTSAAYAEDWSSFIDPHPSKPIASQPAPVVKDAAKPKRVAKAPARHKVKVKARARAKTHRK
jgi:hypothetical protein